LHSDLAKMVRQLPSGTLTGSFVEVFCCIMVYS